MVRFAAAALALATGVLSLPALSAEIVLLDFWSPNCGPCMQMKPTVRNFIAAGYPIREVDVTRNVQLARDHKVDGIPCFVMLVDNQEVDRVVGFTSGERLEQMFKRAGDTAKRNADRTWHQSPDTPPPAPSAATQSAAAAEGLAGSVQARNSSESYDKLLASTVRLRVDDAKMHSYGTGTIIDARSGQALVITCGHLFRESEGKAPISVELFETAPGGVRSAGKVPAQLIGYDLERDVALVGIWPTRPVKVAPVAPKGVATQRGDRVVSIGCSNGKDPTALATRITRLAPYDAPPKTHAAGAPVEGRSGGGLFNDQGQLIGVCFAADYEGNEGLYAALESIHEELAENGLSEIYTRVADVPASAMPIVRGQEPLENVAPLPNSVPVTPPVDSLIVQPIVAATTAPQGLNAVEQAAWDEIMNRAATAEVICIIRPKEPGGQSEVITLDDVSPEFVRALAERQRQPQTTTR